MDTDLILLIHTNLPCNHISAIFFLDTFIFTNFIDLRRRNFVECQ